MSTSNPARLAESRDALKHLATTAEEPWSHRDHGSAADGDPRDPYARDRDRILHSENFRRLQHKTQVFIVTEGDLFTTRILHSFETAQIARGIASTLGLNEALADAICLGHDVGHTPFGHHGETTLANRVKGVMEWDSNVHSLLVLEQLETQYPRFKGLDLTWATREGIARHQTSFDNPSTDARFLEYKAPSLEAQSANLADEIAYVTHDLHDALQLRLLDPNDLEDEGIRIWKRAWNITEGEVRQYHPEGWATVDLWALKCRRVHALMIGMLVEDAIVHSAVKAAGIGSLDEARSTEHALVAFSEETREDFDKLLNYQLRRVYRGPVVARQNAKEKRILEAIFSALRDNTTLLPRYVQQRIEDGGTTWEAVVRETAHFVASLTDRAAIDLYDELFTPDKRSMGQHVQ